MTAAREGSVTTPDGRRLAYLERGDPDDPTIVFHHGTPGSRYPVHPDPAVADGFRIVTYDRPGYGGSDPQPGRTVADAAADVATLAGALGLERFAVGGVSGGGPHALACAALLPERVTRTAVLVGVAPSSDPDFDFTAGMAEINVEDFGTARSSPETYRDFLRPDVLEIKADPEAFLDRVLDQMPASDRAAIDSPRVRAQLRLQWDEAVRQDEEGLYADGLAFVAPWGFALDTIPGEVRLWQGELDTLVPRSHGEYMAARIPRARFELVPAEGHLIFGTTRTAFEWLAAGA
jgi:pimeloyl-ACP methyl ester carboxylesterase